MVALNLRKRSDQLIFEESWERIAEWEFFRAECSYWSYFLGAWVPSIFWNAVGARKTASHLSVDLITDWGCVVSLEWCTMDDFALGDCTIADYPFLEDCPYVDHCVFAPEFMSNDYVRVTQLYCDGVVSRFVNFLFLTLCLKFWVVFFEV